MNSRPIRVIQKAMSKKGFSAFEGGNHTIYVLIVGGKKSPVRTIFSRGESEANPWLQGMIACQLHLTKQQFDDLVNCPLKYDQYLMLLSEKGIAI